MFDWDAEERNERPTAARREEARRRGHVARSRDLVAGLSLAAGFCALGLMGDGLLDTARTEIRGLLVRVGESGRLFEISTVSELASRCATLLLIAVVPIGACSVLAGATASLAQTGFILRPQALVPDLGRLRRAGNRRLVSARDLVRTGFGLLKLVLAGYLLWKAVARCLRAEAGTSADGAFTTIAGAWEPWGRSALGLGLEVAAAIVAVGLVEYAFERWCVERDLMMTRSERAEEARREGRRWRPASRRDRGGRGGGGSLVAEIGTSGEAIREV